MMQAQTTHTQSPADTSGEIEKRIITLNRFYCHQFKYYRDMGHDSRQAKYNTEIDFYNRFGFKP